MYTLLIYKKWEVLICVTMAKCEKRYFDEQLQQMTNYEL